LLIHDCKDHYHSNRRPPEQPGIKIFLYKYGKQDHENIPDVKEDQRGEKKYDIADQKEKQKANKKYCTGLGLVHRFYKSAIN
jgi:hypothetical protein